jgi:nucleotide-binding universal stress UspA family protein
MSYAAILVHAEADSAALPRLELAADLANQFGAVLIGVGAESYEPPTAAAAVGYADGETLVAEARVVQDDLKLAEQRFREAARYVNEGLEWRCAVAMPAKLLISQAAAADLIVVGPRRPEPYGFHNRADPGDLLMEAGRPILITPPALTALDASNVVIAWKDARESRRAVADALPFLKRAKKVLIAGLCEDRDEKRLQIELGDVAGFLGRHGVKAGVTIRAPGKATVAEAVLEIADLQGAGLIVAGGYGHARFREWAFGGVTEELLAGVHRAVLLSH